MSEKEKIKEPVHDMSDKEMEYLLKEGFPTQWDFTAIDDIITTMKTAKYFDKEIKKGKTEAVCMAEARLKMLKGKEIHIPYQVAFEKIYIIDGKSTCMTELQMALIKRDCPKCVILVEEQTDQRCIIMAKRPEDPKFTKHEYTIDKAKKQSYYWNADKTVKDKWNTMPDTMLYNRCASQMARQQFPKELHGMSYTPDELGVDIDEDGNIIEPKLPPTSKAIPMPTITPYKPESPQSTPTPPPNTPKPTESPKTEVKTDPVSQGPAMPSMKRNKVPIPKQTKKAESENKPEPSKDTLKELVETEMTPEEMAAEQAQMEKETNK